MKTSIPFWYIKEYSFIPEASFGLQLLPLLPSVCVCVSDELVCTTTHHPFKLGSSNMDQRCKTPWLRSLLFARATVFGLQGVRKPKDPNFMIAAPTVSQFPSSARTYLYRNQKSEIRKRLFGIFTVRRKWLHKHALFCKFKVSQCWMQRNLLLEPCKRLNIVRKKHSQLFMSFMNFRCISSAIWSVKLPSLAVRGGTVGTFCIAATVNVS